MAIYLTDIKTSIDQPEQDIFHKAKKTLGLAEEDIDSIQIYKKSLDARKQSQILFVSSVAVHLTDPSGEENLCQKLCRRFPKLKGHLSYKQEEPFQVTHGTIPLKAPIYVVGFGPAGIFCAYLLAEQGYHPIVLERGYPVEDRVKAVEHFWQEGKLNPSCNVQFGEGGAGTFSDGKLTTRISDSRCDYVLQLLSRFGAPQEILTKAKPHIGTDKLRLVIQNLRKEIIRLGGEVRFESCLEEIRFRNGKVASIVVNGEELPAQNVVLAVGHSARDTFSMLCEKGILLEPKSFSVGVRVEHLQTQINEGLYGKMAGHPNLPKGEYQLSYRERGRGVYTFCMCPGGTVVPSASSEGTVVTNGMSEFARDGKNANSAMVVSVDPADFGTHPLDGMKFQQQLESAAFVMGGKNYQAPAMTVRDFLEKRPKLTLGRVKPTYALGVQAGDFYQLFPSFVTDLLQKGFEKFNKKLPGFAAPDTVMTGVETRTSSPVRILRNETYQAVGFAGLYPCGEGAGYAGGIVSAAVDGLRVAQQLIGTYQSR